MNETILAQNLKERARTSSSEKRIRWSCIVDASAFSFVGLVMLGAALLTASVTLSVVEIALSAGMLAAAFLLGRTVLNGTYRSRGVGLLAGEIGLACAFVYLGVAMPAFHQGFTSLNTARVQFLAVLASLIFGSAALALSGFSKPSRRLGQVTFPSMVRDGVILLTGTIVLAIALAQLAGPAITPPHWNWISFLGITLPGMLLLVIREACKERFETQSGPRSLLSLLLTETLLVSGLALMFYGSYANLTLGVNGYQLSLKGNTAGLVFWLVAVLLLLIVRGTFKTAFSHHDNRIGYRITSKVLYVLAVIPFIYGEKAIITGKAPLFLVGAAAPAVAIFLLGGLLVLVVGRSINQKVSIG